MKPPDPSKGSHGKFNGKFMFHNLGGHVICSFSRLEDFKSPVKTFFVSGFVFAMLMV